MTNYSERLYDVLRDHRGRVLTYHELFRRQHHNPHRLDADLAHADDEAKQAITSLIKELVAEAEPVNKQGEIDIDEPAYNDGYWSGAYNALEKFKQNLLKALEEV